MFHWHKLGRVFIPQEVTGRPLDGGIRPGAGHRAIRRLRASVLQLSATTRRCGAVREPVRIRRPRPTRSEAGPARERTADPSPRRVGGVRRIRHLPGLGRPAWRRLSRLLRRLDPLRIGAVQRRHRHGDQRRRRRSPSKSGRGPVLSYSPDEPFVLSGPKIRQIRRARGTCSTSPAASGSSSTAGRSRSTRSAWPPPTTASTGRKHGRDLIEQPRRGRRGAGQPRRVLSPTAGTTCSSATATAATTAAGRTATASAMPSTYDLLNWKRDDTRAGIDVSE